MDCLMRVRSFSSTAMRNMATLRAVPFKRLRSTACGVLPAREGVRPGLLAALSLCGICVWLPSASVALAACRAARSRNCIRSILFGPSLGNWQTRPTSRVVPASCPVGETLATLSRWSGSSRTESPASSETARDRSAAAIRTAGGLLPGRASVSAACRFGQGLSHIRLRSSPVDLGKPGHGSSLPL